MVAVLVGRQQPRRRIRPGPRSRAFTPGQPSQAHVSLALGSTIVLAACVLRQPEAISAQVMQEAAFG
jgi:hypothetical protein